MGDVLGKVVEARLSSGVATGQSRATKERTGHRPTFTMPWLEPKGLQPGRLGKAVIVVILDPSGEGFGMATNLAVTLLVCLRFGEARRGLP